MPAKKEVHNYFPFGKTVYAVAFHKEPLPADNCPHCTGSGRVSIVYAVKPENEQKLSIQCPICFGEGRSYIFYDNWRVCSGRLRYVGHEGGNDYSYGLSDGGDYDKIYATRKLALEEARRLTEISIAEARKKQKK